MHWRKCWEMRPASSSLDAIENRLERLDWLRQAERRAAISRVASVIAHLIGTPLHVIAGRAALIRSNPTSESVEENARRIEAQVERLAQRIRKLIDYLTGPALESEPQPVDALVGEALSLYAPIAALQGIEIISAEAPSKAVVVDGAPVLLVLTSLFSLGVRIAAPGARIDLGFEHAAGSAFAFELSIPGVTTPKGSIDHLDPPEDQVADPETLQVLSVCNAIARQHGGRLQLSEPLPGRMAIRFECQTLDS
jgi:two-component system NtrC family sensor kinase